MSQIQQSQQHSLWTVSQGEAMSLTIGPGARELYVAEGRLWLTLPGEPGMQPEDHWLEAGQGVHLASGSRVVMEAWPQAQFQLLVPPTACADHARRQSTVGVMPFWRRFLTSSPLASLAS